MLCFLYLYSLVLTYLSNFIYSQPVADSGNVSNSQVQSSDRSATPLLPDPMDPTMWYANGYAPYYYGGNAVTLLFNFCLHREIFRMK